MLSVSKDNANKRKTCAKESEGGGEKEKRLVSCFWLEGWAGAGQEGWVEKWPFHPSRELRACEPAVKGRVLKITCCLFHKCFANISKETHFIGSP